MTIRTTIKHLIERGIILSGVAAFGRARRRSDVVVLAYHNIVPDGERSVGDRSLHLPQRTFARQLDLIQRTHDVISIRQLLDGSMPMSRRPRAVITFDDAYLGALTAGLTELRQRGLPATMFIAPAYVNGATFWWDMLTPANAESLDPAFRATALTTDAGRQTSILDRARHDGVPTTALPAHATCASETLLQAALDFDGLTYGAHTWSHPNLTALTSDALAEELTAPQAWLGQFGARALPIVSYPYGQANETVWRAAEAAGYTAGFMIDGGWARPTRVSRVYDIPRLNIPAGVSADGFVLRASGVVAA